MNQSTSKGDTRINFKPGEILLSQLNHHTVLREACHGEFISVFNVSGLNNYSWHGINT